MNDPGLDSAIENDAQIIEHRKESDEKDEAEEDEQAFLNPSRWWFASTAFPLIAGTFGPMASAFSICALAIHWRVTVPPGKTGATGNYIEDPSWLIGINAVQLAVALISNLFLLLNMAERIRFSIAQPLTIIGWYISSFVLVGLTATGAGPLDVDSSHNAYAFSQAFYYATFAAGLYFLVASLMVATVIGAYRGHYEKEFKLTMSQRTLMLQTISFLVYLLSGAAVYAHIEGWDFLDAVYFADVTLLTVGIGDFTPTTHLGRSLLFPYAIGGIIILGLVIGSIRGLVLDRAKVKVGARMLEKEREHILKKVQRKKSDLLMPIPTKESVESGALKADQQNLSERQRREKEFNMMRKAQEMAASKRRWTSLAISAMTWFTLWFAGAAVFYVSESTQQWTYFESLYFAYTSLLTIGYGDISPESNVGKPFFVFWSLLAVPSLTVLISNMGDTIVKGIRDLTLWLGELTVLPGEHGAWTSVQQTLRSIMSRTVFGANIEEKPAGILGELDDKGDPDEDEDRGGEAHHHHKNDPESAAQRVASGQAATEARRAKKEGLTGDENAIPKSKRHYHTILIHEIGSVMQHLNSSPPRKYTFDEWAWYLKLVGEDESNADTHRAAVHKPRPDQVGTRTGEQLDRNERVKWSWIGNRSPLMGNKEEAEWVLERLTKTLERELEAMRREEEGNGVWAKGGLMNGVGRSVEGTGHEEGLDGTDAADEEGEPSTGRTRTSMGAAGDPVEKSTADKK